MQTRPADNSPAPAPKNRRRIILPLTAIVVVLLPMLQIVRPGLWPNHPDYDTVAWSIAYTGRYIAVHGQVPICLDSELLAGNMQPVFYAPLLFPLLGLASNAIGVADAMRWFAVVCWGLQFILVSLLAGRVMALPGEGTRSPAVRWRALSLAALTCWTIYPLTNLYHRGAYAEFTAGSLLTSAIAAGGLALLEKRRTARIAAWALCVWCGALAAGTHSITAVLGGVMGGLIALAALPIGLRTLRRGLPPRRRALRQRPLRRRRLCLAATAMLVAIILSPWLYASARFGGSTEVARKTGRVIYEPLHDNPLARLSPFPTNETVPNPWPHLHTQINAPLLLIFVWLLIRLAAARRTGNPRARARLETEASRWGALLRVAIAIIVVTLIVSTSATIVRELPRALSFIQYIYRLNSYTNLALLAGTLALLAMLRQQPRSPPVRRIANVVWVTAIALSLGGMIAKLKLAGETLIPSALSAQWHENPDSLIIAPERYHGHKDYVVPDDTRLLSDEPVHTFRKIRWVSLSVGVGGEFGKTQDLVVDQREDGWVMTNVITTPWNALLIDGQPVEPARVREASRRLVAWVGAGRRLLNYRPAPDAAWLWLRSIGGWTFIALTSATVSVAACAALLGRRNNDRSPESG